VSDEIGGEDRPSRLRKRRETQGASGSNAQPDGSSRGSPRSTAITKRAARGRAEHQSPKSHLKHQEEARANPWTATQIDDSEPAGRLTVRDPVARDEQVRQINRLRQRVYRLRGKAKRKGATEIHRALQAYLQILTEEKTKIDEGDTYPIEYDEMRDALTRLNKALQGKHAVKSQAGYEVYINLDDEPTRAHVTEWLERETTELLPYPGGSWLQSEILGQVAESSEMYLRQSQRSAKMPLKASATMRKAVLEGIAGGHYDDEYVEYFRHACAGSDWPRDDQGKRWPVDHVMELWQEGEDDIENYMPLDTDLHRVKTEILERFRETFRENSLNEAKRDDDEKDDDEKDEESEGASAARSVSDSDSDDDSGAGSDHRFPNDRADLVSDLTGNMIVERS
jgi:hypothetical protein